MLPSTVFYKKNILSSCILTDNIVSGYSLTTDQIEDVRAAANLPPLVDIIDDALRDQCEAIIPNPEDIPVEHIKTAFMLLKNNINIDTI